MEETRTIEDIGVVVEQKAFEQLGVLVLDGSSSMREAGDSGQSKGDEVAFAVRDLIARLKGSRHRENFSLALVTYDDKPSDKVMPTAVMSLDETADYNPLVGHGGATAIGDALQRAGTIAEDFLKNQSPNVPRSCVLVVLSDGQNNRGVDPVAVAGQIKSKERTRICAAAYGRSVDEQTLKSIATDASGYVKTQSADDLKKFFVASISQGRI
jgi:uncharacterized protein YegL